MINQVKISGKITYIAKKGPYNDVMTVDAVLLNEGKEGENAPVKVSLFTSFNYKENRELFEKFCNINQGDRVYVEGEFSGSAYLAVKVNDIIKE